MLISAGKNVRFVLFALVMVYFFLYYTPFVIFFTCHRLI
jgi:hypothetical protein